MGLPLCSDAWKLLSQTDLEVATQVTENVTATLGFGCRKVLLEPNGVKMLSYSLCISFVSTNPKLTLSQPNVGFMVLSSFSSFE